MAGNDVSIPIENQEISELRKERLRALESVNGPQRRVEFNRLALVHTAAKGGDLDEFIEGLEKYSAEESASLSVIISTKLPPGNSLLHIVAGIENANILRALLEVIPDLLLTARANHRGDTPLHVAARARRFRMAELLLDFGSIVDEANKAGNRALHEAVKNGDLELTDPLLDFGSIVDEASSSSSSIVDKANKAGNRALHEAVKNGDLELTDLLLRRGSKSVNKENKEGKCPLYLAVETGNLEILSRLLQAVDGNEVLSSGIEGMLPVHGAVMHQRSVMLEKMLEWKKELFDLRDVVWGTPLHLAAYANYIDGVEFLVNKFASSAFEHNREGYLPIHIACKMGHLETIKVLRQHWPDWLELEELLTLKEQQNILHVVAKYGRASVVKYILGDPKLEKLINVKDEAGNTPLHLATLQWQPEVLLYLSRDNRVNLNLTNHGNLTALDIVDERLWDIDPPLHKSLTGTILVSAGTSRSKDKAIFQRKGLGPRKGPPFIGTLKSCAEFRMVVATLVATVTFAAGFAVPGGFKGSEPDAGIATLLNKPMFDVFVICNSMAMYNSIIAVVILLWTHINDSHAVLRALRTARIPLLTALATMSVAFMAGVYVIISKSTWIAVVALIIGITGLFVILILYIALYVPLGYKYRLVQLFADCIIRAAILISRRVTEGASEENYDAHTSIVACV